MMGFAMLSAVLWALGAYTMYSVLMMAQEMTPPDEPLVEPQPWWLWTLVVFWPANAVAHMIEMHKVRRARRGGGGGGGGGGGQKVTNIHEYQSKQEEAA